MKLCPLCETVYPTGHTTCSKEGCGARLVESRLLEPGTVIREKYRILKFIGRGGMGTVYLAEHIHLNERHALKFISGDLTHDPKVLKRFRQEAQALRRLINTNIVRVDDLDQADDGSFYIAMEFVDGLGLRDVISAGPLPIARAIAIAHGVASGLIAAHAKGIIHRDIKPDNILLDHSAFRTAGTETPKLLDFGIAAVKETATALSRTNGLMLTPQYAAPEQWSGMPADQIDGRTDLYALGGVLHEMLTGTTCLHSQTFDGWMYQHLQAERTAPSQKRPELANWPGLDALVLSLLAKDRNDRPGSAVAVIERLDQLKPRGNAAFEQQGKTQLEDRSTHVLKVRNKIEPESKTGNRLLEKQLPTKPRPGKLWPLLASIVAVIAVGIGLAVWRNANQKASVDAGSPATGRLIVTSINPDHSVIAGTSLTLKPVSVPESRTYTCITSAAGSCSLTELPPGTYRLQADHAGFQTYLQEDVSITTNELTTLPITLQAIGGPPPPAGRLTVTSTNPDHAVISGTSLSLENASSPNGRTYACTTSATGSCSINDVPPGTYLLHANHTGFQPYLHAGIRVTSREETTLPITLQAISSPPPPPPADCTQKADEQLLAGDAAAAVATCAEVLRRDPGNETAIRKIKRIKEFCNGQCSGVPKPG